jgi:hypothetical protein
MAEDRDLLKRVLIDLDRQGRQEMAASPPHYEEELWRDLQAKTVSEVELENGLSRDVVDFKGYWLALPLDPSQTWRPILWVEIDFTRSTARFQVVLSSVKEAGRTLGFRFETPDNDSGATPGVHHYHHMQLSTEVRPRGPAWGPPWFPKSFPTFPLDASTPVSLALCLLLSLYGFGFERTYISEATVQQNLRRHYRGMCCLGPLLAEQAETPRRRNKKAERPRRNRRARRGRS